MPSNAKSYRAMPYRRSVVRITDDDGSVYFVARVDEIPALRIHGDTKEEALLKLDEIFDDFIEAMLEAGDEIPKPERWPGWSPTSNPGASRTERVEEYEPRNIPVVMPQSVRPWETTSLGATLAGIV